jgi:hypothetical protein
MTPERLLQLEMKRQRSRPGKPDMCKTSKFLLTAVATVQLATVGLQAALYQLDNNNISTALNASDTTEPRDNWFGNVFTALSGANLITRVDFGVFTTTPGSLASLALYRVTDPGGNPALGATRVFTQTFTPLVGDGTNAFLQSINLSSAVAFNVGDKFLVSVLIRNVIGAPPNDVYPFLLDTSGNATGTFWDRSTPNAFNLDDLTGAIPINQAFVPGGFNPGPGHIFLRAYGMEVPEPSTLALAGLAFAAAAIFRQRQK